MKPSTLSAALSSTDGLGLAFRRELAPGDAQWIRGVVRRAGVFSEDEVDIAVELVEERLAKGPKSGYDFVFAERDGAILGYTCYGPIPATVLNYEMYWIAVDPSLQCGGVGGALLAETERLVRQLGARNLYAETSSRDVYLPARTFYEHHGFHCAAVLKDYHDLGDSKVVYAKAM